MAHFQRSKSGKLKIKYYDSGAKKYVSSPRVQIAFLDSASDEQVKGWLRLWEQESGRLGGQIVEASLRNDDEVQILFNDFLRERAAMRNLSSSTFEEEHRRFRRWIAPFFVAKHGKWANGVLERPFGRGLNFQINVNDVESLCERLVAAGHQLKIPVEEISYRRGDHAVHVRQCLVLDLDGYLLRLAQIL